jgi:SAM-dependent methyltransferase
MPWKYKIDYPIDSPERTFAHRRILRTKKFLQNLYRQWYSHFLKEIPSLPPGKLLELGSGGGFLKDLDPRIITSDVQQLPTNDMTFSAVEMPFENQSLAAIFMIDTLHHIPDPAKFFAEAERTLMPGGIIKMIEPANTLWGRFIYKNFHHEAFDTLGEWTLPANGPLSSANGALPWIIFSRDREKFNASYPDLEVREITYTNPFLYLVSGGFTSKQLIPDFLYHAVELIDRILPILSPSMSMFQIITVKKKMVR